MERLQPETDLGRILTWCEEAGASDLHGRADKPFFIRVEGKLMRVSEFPSPGAEALEGMLREGFSERACDAIVSGREVDLSFYFRTQRYRANFSKQQGEQSFSFRIVPQQRMKLADLQLPLSLAELCGSLRGLILLTGPTGQGKSTTARAMLQEINERHAVRIITVEDPIEYVFEEASAQFEQREVGIDTGSFADGIRNAMRQDPNVIFVGEIRDAASIWAAMQAAETGHLVLTTLHADSVAQAVGRIREFYPSSEQNNISSLLARNLVAVISQRLLPNVEGGRTPCLEVMRRDRGVEEAIRSNDLTLLTGIVEAAVGQGMHTFDQYLMELLTAGVVTEEVARRYAVDRHRLDMALRGIEVVRPILRLDQI